MKTSLVVAIILLPMSVWNSSCMIKSTPKHVGATGGVGCAAILSSASVETIVLAAGACAVMGYLYGQKLEKKRKWALATEAQIEARIQHYRQSSQKLEIYNASLEKMRQQERAERARLYQKNKGVSGEIKAIDGKLEYQRDVAVEELNYVNELLQEMDYVIDELKKREGDNYANSQYYRELKQEQDKLFNTKRILYSLINI